MRIGYGTSITVPQSSERWYTELRAGRCFFRGVTLSPGGAAIGEGQLFNPVGSGKTIDIYRILCGTDVSGGLDVRTYNTALATLQGVGINLTLGGAAGVGELRTSVPAAADGTYCSTLYTAAFTQQELGAVWICELDPGEGVLVTTRVFTVQPAYVYFWNEF